jgi:hypothetical protein
MPATRLDPLRIPPAGVDPGLAPVDLVNGNAFEPSFGRILLFRNPSTTTAVNVTFPTPGTVAGLAIDDLVVPVPASGFRVVSFGDAVPFRNPATGLVEFTAAAAVDVAVLQAA